MYVAQSLTVKELDDAGFFPSDERDLGDAFEPEEGKDALGITITRRSFARADDEKPPGFVDQTKLLFLREWRNLLRDVTALGARFGLTIFLSVLIGTIFLDVGETDSAVAANLQSHFGALIMVLLMSMFGTAQPALLSFPEERPVFLREYSTSHYTVGAYFYSRLTMEALLTGAQVFVMTVITYFMIAFQMEFWLFYVTVYSLAMASTALAVLLGASLESPKVAQEMLPILFVPQMLFAGFFVVPDLIPVWLRWARYLCTLTYALRIIMVGEFENCDPSDEVANEKCNDLLVITDAIPDDTWWNWIVLLCLFAFFRLLALMVLKQKATKFY